MAICESPQDLVLRQIGVYSALLRLRGLSKSRKITGTCVDFWELVVRSPPKNVGKRQVQHDIWVDISLSHSL